MFEQILVAVDGSEPSHRALATAIGIAQLTGGHLVALAVEGPLPAYAATIGEVEEVKREKDAFFGKLLADVRRQAAAADVSLETVLRPGHASELIVRAAAEHAADLIVLGHKGHFLRDHLLGSTADRVSEHAHCPVLIVR